QKISCTFVYFDIKHRTSCNQADLLNKFHLARVELAETSKLKHSIHFFVGNERNNQYALWPSFSNKSRSDRYIISGDFSPKERILLNSRLADKAFGKLEPTFEVLLLVISVTCLYFDEHIIFVIVIDYVKSSLNSPYLIGHIFYHIISQRFKIIVCP